ncbi:MAG: N-carbamoylputrescine amidase / Aliphatic amidase AmiE, partial [uncultured Quadrisphaera sp.]
DRSPPEPGRRRLRARRTGPPHRARRPGADHLDRRQGVDDRRPRGRPAAGRGAGGAGDLLPGAVLRPVLLPGAGRRVLRLRRVRARPHHRALRGAGRRARHGRGAPGLRAGAAGRPLQHGRGDRRRRHLPRQVPQEPHPARERVLGEVLLPPREPGVPRLRHRRGPGRGLHLLRPPLPGGLARAGPERRGDRVQPLGHLPRAEQLPVEARADRRGRGQRVLRGHHQPGRGRGPGRRRLLRHLVLRRPRGPPGGRLRLRREGRGRRPRPRHEPADHRAQPVAVLPRPPARQLRRPGRPL